MDEQALLSFGLWIKRRRKALDLTQDALAALVGCSKELIVKIEGDARRPSREIAALLAQHLELAPEERADFIRCARAELAPDRLPLPSASAPRAAFPPRPPAEHPHSNLPAQLSSFLSREQELADLRALLQRPDVRLITLTGVGGTGKTRLGLQAAAELLEVFADGVFFVDLAPISDPDLVAAAIAQTLGVIDAGNQTIRERLKALVRTRLLLLLLDNFEQVLDAAPLVAELLAAAAGLKVLVTSRAVLHLSGEHEYTVLPLALPPTTAHPDSQLQAGLIGQYAAVQLFIARAQAAKADFVVTNANAPAVAEICVRLDGLPLAIELAAARVKLFAPEALLARLSAPLALLTGGARDLPARQQTIRGTIDWSYTLLDADEQRLFRRLGVFVGGWTLEAAETICGGWEVGVRGWGAGAIPPSPSPQLPTPILDGLAALLDHSLVIVLEPAGGEPRYGMLELMHEYALERLREAGEDAETRRRHAAHLLEWVDAVGPKVGGHESHQALERLEAELPNIRAVFAWAVSASEHDLALRLASALLPLWLNLGHRGEGSAILRAALSSPSAGSPIVRARALSVLGRLNWRDTNRWPETRATLEESLTIFRALGDLDGIAEVLSDLAFVELLSGDIERSVVLEEESLRDARAARNKDRAAWALQGLAWKAFLKGDDARGSAMLDESQALFAELKDQFGYAVGIGMRGWAAQEQGDSTRALALMRESLALVREGGHSLASELRHLGRALMREGDYWQATNVLQESLAELREGRVFERIPPVLNMLGEAALARGSSAEARARFQESQTLCHDLGNTWDTAGALLGEGHVALAEGDSGAASAACSEALKLFANLPDWDDRRRRTGIAACLSGLAGVVAPIAPERAARLWGSAEALRATVDQAALAEFALAYPLPADRAAHDLSLAAVRAALGAEAFQAAWAEGQVLTLEQAIAEVLAITATAAALPADTLRA
jgi:predicted ATPase/DNA-binding XRE family transcriptional regulator